MVRNARREFDVSVVVVMHVETFHNLLSSRELGTLNCGMSLRERRTAVRWRFRPGSKTRMQFREMTVLWHADMAAGISVARNALLTAKPDSRLQFDELSRFGYEKK